MKQKPTKNVFRDLENEIDQIWAEAIFYFRKGEVLYLQGDEEQQAKEQQGLHLERHPWEGPIHEFVTRKVTKNWLQMSITSRKSFGTLDENDLVERDRICAAEIWCECLENELNRMKLSDAKIINGILSNLNFDDRKLEPMRGRFGNDYGIQRGFKIELVKKC